MFLADRPAGSVPGCVEVAKQSVDESDDLGATFFIGSAIDDFAANDLQRYLAQLFAKRTPSP